MNQILGKNLKSKLLCSLLLSLSLFSFGAVCEAAVPCKGLTGTALKNCQLQVMKTTYSVNVTTTNVPGGWFNEKDADLNTHVTCNYNEKGKNTNYHTFGTPKPPVPCNTVATSMSFYYSDVSLKKIDDESNVIGADKAFTITAKDSGANGIAQIRIEWGNRSAYDVPNTEAEWKKIISDPEKGGSVNCPGGVCTVCREGVNCANPLIKVNQLSVQENGNSNTLYFRVIMTDNDGNTIATGNDTNKSIGPVLDKYYKFTICGPKCIYKCTNAPIEIDKMNLVDKCAAKQPYSFNWSLKDAKDKQSAFVLEVADAATGKDVYVKEVSSSVMSFSDPLLTIEKGGVLLPNTTYIWRLRVKDAYIPSTCSLWSAWKEADKSFTTCNTGTSGSCIPANVKPTAATIKAEESMHDLCKGFLYRLSWSFFDPDGAQKQGAFELNMRQLSTKVPNPNPVYNTGKILSSDTSYTLFDSVLKKMGLKINYGSTYEWQVKVYDNDSRTECVLDSGWSDWTGTDASKNIKTPDHQYPQVSFRVENADKQDCTAADKPCKTLQDITFTDQSTVFASDPSKGYEWYLDAATKPDSTASFFTKSYLPKEGASKAPSVTLKITDKSGYSCSKTATFGFEQAKPVWNEITPK